MGGVSKQDVKAISKGFEAIFEHWRVKAPRELLSRERGMMFHAGWSIQWCSGAKASPYAVVVFASHRMTNDRLYAINQDGRAELIGASLDVFASSSDEARREETAFYEQVAKYGLGPAFE